MNLHCKIYHGLENMADTMALRNTVFHEEQHFNEQIDETDAVAYHYVIYDGDSAIATGRSFFYQDKTYKVGRVCVLKSYRGQNIGQYLMNEIQNHLAGLGMDKIQLSAQDQAIGFYERLGFHAVSDFYMDEHCPHKDMVKAIG